MFLNHFYRNLDEKSRLIFPSVFRKELGYPFYITPGLTDKCLEVYPQKEWDELVKRLQAIPKSDQEGQDFLKWFFAYAFVGEWDKMGRVALPSHLIEYAELKEEVVISGNNNKLQIWSKDNWQGLVPPQEFLQRSRSVISRYNL